MRRTAVLLLVLGLAGCAQVNSMFGNTFSQTPQQRFVVFFQEWSAGMDPAALNAVATAAQWAKDHPAAPVTVTGFADPTGSVQANVYLSETRAQVVADQLVQDGVARDRIRQIGSGSISFAQSSQESRRVEIAIAGF